MRYRIISDNPGRIRVRFGTYAFDKPLEGSIRKLAEGRSFVLSAEVHSANGGLLICYRKGSRREVISFIDSLDFRAITPMPEETRQRRSTIISRAVSRSSWLRTTRRSSCFPRRCVPR